MRACFSISYHCVLAFCLVVSLGSLANAYTNPGTGLLLFQVLSCSATAAIVYFRQDLWRACQYVFRSGEKKDPECHRDQQ